MAVRYSRQRRIPTLGLCMGMQCMVIELTRTALGAEDANSTEFDAFTPHPVIDLLPEQRDVADKGGTMRLGSYPCVVEEGSRAYEAYGQPIILERHRHRYEFNNAYRELLASHGLRFSGLSPDGRLVEIVELRDHPSTWHAVPPGVKSRDRPTAVRRLRRQRDRRRRWPHAGAHRPSRPVGQIARDGGRAGRRPDPETSWKALPRHRHRRDRTVAGGVSTGDHRATCTPGGGSYDEILPGLPDHLRAVSRVRQRRRRGMLEEGRRRQIAPTSWSR